MSPVDAFLADLGRRNLRVSLDGDQLRVTPRAALDPALVEQLRARKPEIVAYLRARTVDRDIRPAPHTGPAPLSYAQERLWLLHRLDPADTAYTMSVPLRFGGSLDVPALTRALAEIVARHASLRTRYEAIDGRPVQVVDPPAFTLEIADPPADALVLDPRPFDLSAAPPLRARLLRLAPDDHVLHLEVHHIAADGVSIAVLLHELATLYSAFHAGAASPLPPLVIQYPDFAAWQRRRADAGDSLAYWRRQLADARPLVLPPDAPRPVYPTHAAGCVAVALPDDLVTRLRDLGRAQGTTLFVTLLAAFKLLLARLTEETDVVVGTPVAHRSHVALEGLIGLFLNTLVLRTDLSGAPTFVELLQRVRRTCADALVHQDVPFERLVAELQPTRQPGRSPLFAVLFNMIPPQPALPAFSGLSLAHAAATGEEQAKYDLTLYAAELAGPLELRAVYSAELFTADRITHVLEQLHHLLAQLAADPARPIDAYSLIPPSACAAIPDPTAPLPPPAVTLVPARLAAVAARTPDAIAIIHADRRWTYRALAEQVDHIARALRSADLQPGHVAAIHGPRCFARIAAMLGVLTAGGVLLLLDPGHPAAQQLAALAAADARHLLAFGDVPPWPTDHLRTIDLDPDRGLADPPPADPDPRRTIDPDRSLADPPPAADDPAYVFFTSGSTGASKGVLGVHRGLAHFLQWQRDTWSVGPADRAAQLTAPTFDVVLRDVLVAPLSGGTLVLPDSEHDLADGARLAAWLRRADITLVHLVPSLAQAWLAAMPAGTTLPRLRLAFFAGEPLQAELVRQWRAVAPNCRVINLYGPTETTLARCAHEVPDPPPPGIQPVGHPLPDTQALVLRGDRPCGLGEPGEVVIRTPCRTRGYLAHPDEQRLRFQPSPFTRDPADILYRTGDRARRRQGGALELLGRTDDQVKIRGVRVELRAVEAVLSAHPDIQQAVVVTAGDGPDRRLVAHIVARRHDRADLRRHLREHLPDAMIPAAFVAHDRLPLLANGKVDRRALPPPQVTPDRPHVPPRTAQELQLVHLWEDTLGVAPIGVTDNFFDLGGHSLLAVRLLARQRERLGDSPPVALFFRDPTIEGLAGLLGRRPDFDPWTPLVAVRTTGARPPLFCAPGGHGEVHYLHLLAHHLGADQPLYALQAIGLDGATTPPATLHALASRYLAEVRRVRPRGPYFLCGHSFGGRIVFAMADLLVRADEAVHLIMLDSLAPDMSHGEALAWDDIDVILEIVGGLEEHHGRTTDLTRAGLAAMTPDDRLDVLRTYLENGDMLPRGTSLAVVAGKVRVFQASKRLAREQPAPLAVPLHYFAAEAGGADLTARKIAGWSRYARVHPNVVPGTHLSMLQEPHVRGLARRLAELVREPTATANPGPSDVHDQAG